MNLSLTTRLRGISKKILIMQVGHQFIRCMIGVHVPREMDIHRNIGGQVVPHPNRVEFRTVQYRRLRVGLGPSANCTRSLRTGLCD